MKEQQLQRLRLLVQQHNIQFDLNSTTDQWPAYHRDTFKFAKDMGSFLFTDYGRTAALEAQEKPWKTRMRHRAEVLAQTAIRASRESRNESGWRSLLEPLIFARFSVEVSWNVELGFGALRSSHRKQALIPMLHHWKSDVRNLNFASTDTLKGTREPGINEIFSDRVGERISHEETISQALPKREYPDRIFGLCQTRRFERALAKPFKRKSEETGKQVLIREEIRSSPFLDSTHPLLFPFLILEAKSEKGSVGFDNVQTQTAFPILALLKLQEHLQEATSDIVKHRKEPLVWFFATQGDVWRLYAAYIEQNKAQRIYKISAIWDGRISSNDGALQVLLLVDYIFDWARDNFRDNLLIQLKDLSLTANEDLFSLETDSDIFSRTKSWVFRSTYAESVFENGISEEPIKVLPPAPTSGEHGYIRESSSIKTQFRGLHLDSTNIFPLAMQFHNSGLVLDKVDFVDAFAGLNKNSAIKCLITRDTLHQLEMIWTGHVRELTPSEQNSPKLWALINFTTYLSTDWQHMRTISYIAAPRDVILMACQYRGIDLNAIREPPAVCFAQLEDIVRDIKGGSVIHNLSAAISRSTFSLPRAIFDRERSIRSSTRPQRLRPSRLIERGDDWDAYEFVFWAHRTQAELQKSSTNFWPSSSCDEQQYDVLSKSGWPTDVEEIYCHADKVALVYGDVQSARSLPAPETRAKSKPSFCLFTIHEDSFILDKFRLGAILHDFIMDWRIYFTYRSDGRPAKFEENLPRDRNLALSYADISTELVYQLGAWRNSLGLDPIRDIPIRAETFESEAGLQAVSEIERKWEHEHRIRVAITRSRQAEFEAGESMRFLRVSDSSSRSRSPRNERPSAPTSIDTFVISSESSDDDEQVGKGKRRKKRSPVKSPSTRQFPSEKYLYKGGKLY